MDPPKTPFSYYNEISLMMYGFGDSHKPNPETVRLVESIVLKQLRAIVNEALKYWDGKALKGEDLVFLLRHNKVKMQRFVRFLQNKAVKNKLKRLTTEVEIDEKPKHKLIDFIEKIDETGEFTDLSEVDEIKVERQIRADRISQALDEKKYMDFHKARCASFKVVGQGMEHLRLWIDPKRDINFKPEALDVLSYFAYQTVAELTDYALLVREDMRSGTDPLKHLPGSYYTSAMFNGQHRFEGNNPDYSRVYSSQPPISLNEVKEVMRRVYSPQAGKLNFGGKVPETHYLFAL